ncbi:MAG: ABC transporter substrate-binding protein [Egibacteraceae bacterium]
MGERALRRVAVLAMVAVVAAACTGDGDEGLVDEDTEPPVVEDEPEDEPAERDSGEIIVGTTDAVTSLDPAAVHDYYSATVLANLGDTLVGFEPGATEATPRLAEAVDVSEDGLTYTVVLREGVTFHDGSELDSADVQFSLERVLAMGHPDGAGFLLADVAEIAIPDERTVTITLVSPSATFLDRLAYPVATIVPSDGDYTAPATDADADADVEAEAFVHEELVATGPYRLVDVEDDEEITLEAFDDYWGEAPRNERVVLRFFPSSGDLAQALLEDEIDVAFRQLAPDHRAELAEAGGIQAVEGVGSFIRYLVFNPLLAPVDDANVRRAVAAAIDRERLVDDVFAGRAEPLDSMVPSGFPASADFFSQYQEQDPATFLEGVETPVAVELHYAGEQYGPTEPALAEAIQETLEDTGLFEVTVTSTEWEEFVGEAWPAQAGQYQMFLLGWYPDYFDPDGYLAPFYGSDGFLGVFANGEVDELLAQQHQASAEERVPMLHRVQQIGAHEVPIVPLLTETPTPFARDDITGLEETVDLVGTLRFSLLER